MARILVVAIAALLGAAPGAQASPPTAKRVVAKVQKVYKTTKHFTADFTQTYTNATFGKTDTSTGDVYVAAPGRMRWDYERNGKDVASFISDGKRLWGIDIDNKQASTEPLSKSTLPVAVSFLLGKGNLTKDFSATIDKSSSHGGKGLVVLELTPKKPSAQYKTLWLVVSKKTHRVHKSIVLEASNNTNEFDFANVDTKTTIPGKRFRVSRAALVKAGYTFIKPHSTPPPPSPTP